MKKEKGKEKAGLKKTEYSKPTLIKHKKLKEVTAVMTRTQM